MNNRISFHKQQIARSFAAKANIIISRATGPASEHFKRPMSRIPHLQSPHILKHTLEAFNQFTMKILYKFTVSDTWMSNVGQIFKRTFVSCQKIWNRTCTKGRDKCQSIHQRIALRKNYFINTGHIESNTACLIQNNFVLKLTQWNQRKRFDFIPQVPQGLNLYALIFNCGS